MNFRTVILLSIATSLAFTSCKKAEEESDEIIANFTVGYFLQNNCSDLDSLNSSTPVPATTIYFQNNSNKSLKIDWIDFNGNLLTYKDDFSPGSGHRQATFLTHPWYITTDDGNTCVTILTGLRSGETDTVTFVNM